VIKLPRRNAPASRASALPDLNIDGHRPGDVVEQGRNGVRGRGEPETDLRAHRRVFVALAAVLALDAADRSALGVLAPALKSEFHIGNGTIGLLASAFSIVGGLATIPIGVLTDRTRRVTILVVSILIWCVAMGVAAAALTLAVLFAARSALGILTAAGGPPITSIIGDLVSPDVRGRVIGWVKSGELVGAAAGFVVTGALVSFLSWRSAFVALGLIGLLVAAGFLRIPEPRRGGEDRGAPDSEHDGATELDEPSKLRELIEEEGAEPKPELVLDGDVADLGLPAAMHYVSRVRTLVMIIAAGALGEFFFTALQVFGVLFLVDQFDISASTAALLIPAVGVAGFIGVIAGGRFGDWLLERRVVTGRLKVGAWSYLAVAVLFTPVLLTSSLAVALPFLALAGVFLMAPIAPLEAARLDVVHPQLRGRAESARTVARVVAQAAAPLLFGLLSEVLAGGGADGLRAAFFVFLSLLAVSSLLLVLAGREYPSEVASVQQSVVEEPESRTSHHS
jgi:predicted MFS family arabinose efflux permease